MNKNKVYAIINLGFALFWGTYLLGYILGFYKIPIQISAPVIVLHILFLAYAFGSDKK